MHAKSSDVVMGILVGGQARRMGGVQKALLRTPDGNASLVTRLIQLGRDAGLEVVLIGQAGLGEAAQGVLQLQDAPANIGPLGGLAALLAHAGERPAVAVACDMPYLTAALLTRLVREHPAAALLAPRDPLSGKWQSLFARYDSAVLAPLLAAALAQGERSFQGLFAHAQVTELLLGADEQRQLRDWDTPADLQG